MADNRIGGAFAATLLPRFQALRTDAHAASPRTTLLAESLEELQTAIEELRVTEEELREQQERLAEAWRAAEAGSDWNRALFDGAADALIVTDGDGLVRDANQAAGRLLGIRAGGLGGKPLAVFIPSEDRTAFRQRLLGMDGQALPARFDLRMQPRMEVPVQVEASVASFTPEGATPGLHWTLRDVTSARQADAGERQAGRVHLRALRAMPAATVVLDVDGTVSLWNPAAERLLGWTEEETTGLRVPCWTDAGEQAVHAAMDAAQGPARLSLEVRTRDGQELAVEVAAARIPGGGADAHGTVLTLTPAPAGDAAPAAMPRAEWNEAEMRRVLLGEGGHPDLAERMRTGIAAGLFLGHLRPGDRLPSIRDIARHTGEDHRCVSAGYRRLASEGVVEIRNRHGVQVAEVGPAPEMPAAETAEWLAGVIGDAARLRVKVAQLPELVRRWTATTAVRCLCVDGTEDGLLALTTELQGQWGFDTHRFPAVGAESSRRDALSAALREVDVAVTTPFHAHAVHAAARVAGVPVVVLDADPELVRAAEDRLRLGALTAVVTDARYGERLRALAGGERLRVILADDEEAVAALDPAEPVLMTRAAQQRVRRPLRLLAPVSPAFSISRAQDLAAVLISGNMRAHRTAL